MERLDDDALRAKTGEFRQRLDRGETLDDLLIEAFAVVREAGRRVLGQRHYDVQLMGGAALHFGWVAEMKTGEGKTLVSTLPAYLNGLSGLGMHLVTVNDYLATRDREWMGRLHTWLGLTTGLIIPGNNDPLHKREQYAADITYGTNNEFGFDYLRDNMAPSRDRQVQRGHVYAIVDEVDSILIDEARTPLIISGRVADAAQLYYKFASIGRSLKRDADYEVDEEKRTVAPTEDGIEKVEAQLGIDNLYDGVAQNLVHQLQAALKAKELFKRDKDYVVAGGEVKIVDEFTGRILEGRRWSEGLHQAVEAKEGVRIKEENQTLATVTLQNYFRMYDKLAGMTGTAQSDAAELAATYELQVVPIPTNRPPARLDQADLIYKGEDAKFGAVADDISERYERRPAGAGGHHLGREVRAAVPPPRQAGRHPRGAERQDRPALPGGRDHRPGRAAPRRHRGHQHGGPRRRHHPRRQRRGHGQARRAGRGPRPRRRREPGAGPRADGPARGRHQGRGRQGARARRPLRAGHRAPRLPPHRQPAAGPVRPPGRPGREPLLPQPRRRPHAPVRHRRRQLGHGQDAPRRRAARGQDGDQGHRAGADDRRAAQRRDPQERPQVRRGHERAAQGDLRAARPGARRGRPARAHHRGGAARRRQHPRRDPLRQRVLRGVGPRRPAVRRARLLALHADRRAAAVGVVDHRAVRDAHGRGAHPLRGARGQARTRPHAAPRAPGHARRDRPALAGPPLRDGLPARGHQPPGHGPEGPAHRVAARGLRHVRPDDARHLAGRDPLPHARRDRRRGPGARRRRRPRRRAAGRRRPAGRGAAQPAVLLARRGRHRRGRGQPGGRGPGRGGGHRRARPDRQRRHGHRHGRRRPPTPPS